MNINQVLNDTLENNEISHKKMRYLYDLQTASDRMQKYPELQTITSMDGIALEKHNVQKLRTLAQCIGIAKPNNITSKDELIHNIQTVYQKMVQFEEDVDEEDELMTTIVSVPSLHEQRVQRSLSNGDPLSYDSEAYYDLDSLRAVHSNHSVHFVRKNSKTVLILKSLDLFFSRAVVSLFINHYRCFKYLNKDWYRYTSETCSWEKVLTYDIDDFVLLVFDCIECVAIKIHRDVSNGFLEISNNIEGKYEIVKHATIELKKCIKTCS